MKAIAHSPITISKGSPLKNDIIVIILFISLQIISMLSSWSFIDITIRMRITFLLSIAHDLSFSKLFSSYSLNCSNAHTNVYTREC